MSGLPHELAVCAESSGTTKLERDILYKAVWLLCHFQFVKCKSIGEGVWQVLRGSGMGRVHSGDVADIALYYNMESSMCAVDVLAAHSILGYWSFKDDIIILAGDMPKFHTWFQEVKRVSSIFVFECPQVGRCVNFLDLEISIIGGKFCTRPYVKPSLLNVPLLQSTSAHPREIHMNWPVKLLHRRFRVVHGSIHDDRCEAQVDQCF